MFPKVVSVDYAVEVFDTAVISVDSTAGGKTLGTLLAASSHSSCTSIDSKVKRVILVNRGTATIYYYKGTCDANKLQIQQGESIQLPAIKALLDTIKFFVSASTHKLDVVLIG